ncbi:MAG: DUF1338 domain-containing protein [Plesiomonas sp.]
MPTDSHSSQDLPDPDAANNTACSPQSQLPPDLALSLYHGVENSGIDNQRGGHKPSDNTGDTHDPLAQWFGCLWQDYVRHTPSARQIHTLLGGDEAIVNDHIALRTFNRPSVGLGVQVPLLEQWGYRVAGHYQFTQKQLDAVHLEHVDPRMPKIFMSELRVDGLSVAAVRLIDRLIGELPAGMFDSAAALYAGRIWQLSWDEYQSLRAESEYAAWLAALGFRANHFTVSVNQLTAFHSLAALNQQIKSSGIALNTTGGEIKGSADVYLEQSATLADPVEVVFSDQRATIPGCFYEFALRYRQADGVLYQGFVEASADKIFSSTHFRA